jgi:protocatechuate 3,4-dioxygenase beta subunit
MKIDLARVLGRRRRRRPGWRCSPLAVGLAAAASALLVGSGSAGAATGACPAVNRPNMLKIVAGSPQTAQLEKPFQTNLQVELANSNGCALTGRLGGYWIDFTAPESGASGTFAGSGTHQVTVGTDSTGAATAPTFTANDVAGSYSVRVDSDYGSILLYLTNTASGLAASITAAGETSQEASINSRYAQPLQVQVLDADGRPVGGATVTFALGTGPTGATATFVDGAAQATATTKANGQATSPPFVANGTPGRFTASASTSGATTAVTFTLMSHAVATRIVAAGSAPTASVETRYRQPLRARVVDENGQPIEGASVTFSVTTAANGAGASFLSGESQATRLTDAGGRATSPPLLANKTAGLFTASAVVAGSVGSASYSLQNTAGRPDSITAGGASGQSIPVGSGFPIRLAVSVTDENDNPVADALVTFTAPARGPSGRFASPSVGMDGVRSRRTVRLRTNEKGVAIAPAFKANRISGGYAVTARVAGSNQHAAFALVNEARR